jgi:hypothetical protein
MLKVSGNADEFPPFLLHIKITEPDMVCIHHKFSIPEHFSQQSSHQTEYFAIKRYYLHTKHCSFQKDIFCMMVPETGIFHYKGNTSKCISL